MLGVSDEQVDGAAGACVAQVVQGTGGDAVTAGAVATVGAAAGRGGAAMAVDTGVGQIRGGRDAFRATRDRRAWTAHRVTLRSQASPSIAFTLADPHLVHP